MTSSKLTKGVSNNFKNLGQNILRGTDVFDCEQLYCLLGLLILEGRVPEESEIGRIPGPHAHYAFNNSTFKNHTCDLSTRCCVIAQHNRERLSELARRGQPLSVEVWLLPECSHYDNLSTHRNEAVPSSLSSANSSSSVYESLQLDCPIQDSFLLIEEWIVNIMPKRNFLGPIQNVTTLLRTITSYLHSSKLSTNLIQNKGRSPKNIFYKISSFQNSLLLSSESQKQPRYREFVFPSIGSGESNILSVRVHALVDSHWSRDISCDICAFERLQIGMDGAAASNGGSNGCSSSNRSKLTQSSSVFSVASISGRHEKSISESQDKRRGFTLPIKSTRIRQQIISPMVVCTDQADKPPINLFSCSAAVNTATKSLRNAVVKDSTPYPRYHTHQELSRSFCNSTVHQQQQQQFTGATGPSSSNQTPVNKPRRKSENRIIFTDSSSCESIDKCPSNVLLPLTSSEEAVLSSTSKQTSSFVAGTATGSGVVDNCPYTSCHRLPDAEDDNLQIANFACPSTSVFRMEMHFSNRSGGFFHKKTGLPLQSSPAPTKKYAPEKFQQSDMTTSIEIKGNKSALAMNRLAVTPGGEDDHRIKTTSAEMAGNKNLSSSAPVVSSQKLLVNFEESMLNMRIHPLGVIEGFEVELGASGSFNPKHVRLPLTTYFFQLSDDNAPSPYLGFVDLQTLLYKRGYQIPKKGSIQLTLFNPNGAVIKMFVVLYNLCDMPPNHQTFLRQRTIYMPVHKTTAAAASGSGGGGSNYWSNWTVGGNSSTMIATSPSASLTSPTDLAPAMDFPSYLRYLVHLKLHTSKKGKLYLHTDIRLIFSRDKFEFDPSVATYELRSFVDPPPEPRYSPKS